MDEQKRELLKTIEEKEDVIAKLQLQISSKDALFVAKENGIHFGRSSFIEINDVSQHSEEDGEELKQCDALFGQV